MGLSNTPTSELVKKSQTADELIEQIDKAKEDDFIDTLPPVQRRALEEVTRVRSIGSHGIGRFSL